MDEHAGSIGAERHANADLVAALRNEGGHDAIRPHGGEQQGKAGKEPQELRQEARSLDGFSNDRLHIAKVHHWYSRVHFDGPRAQRSATMPRQEGSCATQCS